MHGTRFLITPIQKISKVAIYLLSLGQRTRVGQISTKRANATTTVALAVTGSLSQTGYGAIYGKQQSTRCSYYGAQAAQGGLIYECVVETCIRKAEERTARWAMGNCELYVASGAKSTLWMSVWGTMW